MPKTRMVLWRRIRELSRQVDVKLVPFPTQHLLNNRGFSSTLLKEDPSMEMCKEVGLIAHSVTRSHSTGILLEKKVFDKHRTSHWGNDYSAFHSGVAKYQLCPPHSFARYIA
jgi:hypothetical protein